MTVKFITVKGPDRLARAPFYLGIPQHERTMSKREAYEHIALKTGYASTAVKAVFMAALAIRARLKARTATSRSSRLTARATSSPVPSLCRRGSCFHARAGGLRAARLFAFPRH